MAVEGAYGTAAVPLVLQGAARQASAPAARRTRAAAAGRPRRGGDHGRDRLGHRGARGRHGARGPADGRPRRPRRPGRRGSGTPAAACSARSRSGAARPLGCVPCRTPRPAPRRSPRRPPLRRSRTSARGCPRLAGRTRPTRPSPLGRAHGPPRLRAWSDCDGDVERRFTKDEILTNVTLYWLTGTSCA